MADHGLAAVVIAVMVALPVAWVAAEFRGKAWLRVILGVATMVAIAWVVYGMGSLEAEFDTNAWFASANRQLVDATVEGLERGNADKVLVSLKELQTQYHPNYENRSHYDALVEQAASRMGTATAPW